eukprot:m.1035397 g.1035397  ORF g.1035397 m.1035397 type:complete len:926 (+) comp24137_c0_seq2:221-2998(+)
MSSDVVIGEVIKSSMVSKRAQGKSTFGRTNWRDRFLVLTKEELSYWDKYWEVGGRPRPSNGAIKKAIVLVSDINSVTEVQPAIFGREGVFKISYTEPDQPERDLFIEAKGAASAVDGDSRSAWIRAIQDVISTRKSGGIAPPIARPAMLTPTAEDRRESGNGSFGSRGNVANASVRRPVPTPTVPTASGGDTGGSTLSRYANESWFAKGMSAYQTADKLMSQPEGSFYVRESSTRKDAYTLDVRTNNPTEPVISKRIIEQGKYFQYEGDDYYHAGLLACIKACDDYKINIPAPSVAQRRSASRPAVPLPAVSERPTPVPRMGSGAGGSKPPVVARGTRPSMGSGAPPPVQPRPTTGFVNSRTKATTEEELDDEIYGTVAPQSQWEDADFSATEGQGAAGDATLRARQMRRLMNNTSATASARTSSSGTAGASFKKATPGGSAEAGSAPSRAKNKLWKERADVIEQGLLTNMSKTEVRRQEAIYELIYSEEAYLHHVNTLINVFLHKIRASGMPFGAQGFLQKFTDDAKALQKVCGAFLTMMQQRQSEQVVVGRIDDVVAKHVESMATRFYEYCEVALETGSILAESSEKLKAFLLDITNGTESDGLTMGAYTLAPVQRMIRYPMLMEEVLKHTEDAGEKKDVEAVINQWKKAVTKCNGRMGEIEEWFSLRDIDGEMNYERLEGGGSPDEHVWHKGLGKGMRSLIKRDALELCKLHDSKKKISKRRLMQVLLLSDMFLFAKPVKEKKTGTIRYMVFKVAHRSLIEAKQYFPAPDASEKLKNMIEITILSSSTEDFKLGRGAETFYFKAREPLERDRWLEAFNPEQDDDDIYQAWDCPHYEVTHDWEPPRDEKDSMPLRRGDIVIVEKKGFEHMKGYLKDPEPFPTYPTSGYFPAAYVSEVVSHRAISRRVKKLHNETSSGNSNFQL